MNQNTPGGEEGDVNFSARRRAWSAQHVGAETQALLDRDAAVFLHQSLSTPCLSAVRRAEGIWIEDLNGRRYMDFHGNNVHHIGYGHPKLIAALTRQMQELCFAPRRYICAVAVELAEKLVAIAPRAGADERSPLRKVLLATGGSDAIEIALAYARAATGRFKTISFWDAFHGAGFGARSVGGEKMFRGGPIGPLLPGAEHVPPFGDYRNAWGVTSGSGDLCANQIRYVLEKEGDIGAVIAEPMRAVPYVPPAGFWQKVRQACDDFGALLIFDEIPTGLGKTGRLFACQHDEVVPDILVLGKSLGGGVVPISAVLCRAELDVCGEFAYGHYTHEKNPVTTRAALTTLRIIEEEGLVAQAARLGAVALARLEEMKERHPLIGDVRGRGCLLGIELVRDRQTREPACEAAEAVLYRALAQGLSFKTTMGNVLTLTPPLITTEAQMHRALDIIESSIAEVEANSAHSGS
jgi:4-aminobutyrate aminotransferase